MSPPNVTVPPPHWYIFTPPLTEHSETVVRRGTLTPERRDRRSILTPCRGWRRGYSYRFLEAAGAARMSRRLVALPLVTCRPVAGQLVEGLVAGHLNIAQLSQRQKPVTADIVAATLSPSFDDLEPRLMRQGYTARTLAEQFHAKPAEIRRFLSGQLDAGRSRELTDQMRAAGGFPYRRVDSGRRGAPRAKRVSQRSGQIGSFAWRERR